MHPTATDTQANAKGRDFSIPATDGLALAATEFRPASEVAPSAPLVVIAPGAAVQRRFYRHIAAYVAERGVLAVTFDPRDIGGSRTGAIAHSKTRMRDWGLKDVAGVIAWARTEHPQRRLLWLGHSMGGFLTGLAPNGADVSRQLSVTTLNGYWGGMAAPEKWRVLAMMGGVAPLVVATRGYMPGALMGGEDMPGPAFLEWRGWCMDPAFLFGDDSLPEKDNFARFTAPIRFLQVSDDPWGTEQAVSSIARRFTGARENAVHTVTPAAAGVGKIGHFGFFRPEMRAAWEGPVSWLLEAHSH